MRAPLISPIRRMRPVSMRPEPPQAGENLRGAGLMTLSMVSFASNDTVMKFVTQEMPLYQAIFLRGLVVVIFLIALAYRKGGRLRRPQGKDRGRMALRVVGEVGSTILFLNALQHMAIGDLSAIMQSLPLVVMVAAAIFLGESLGWRRTLAALVGLIGVLIILRPGGESFGIWSLTAIGAMLMVTLRDLSTRRFSAQVTTTTVSFYAACAVLLTGAVGMAFQGWVTPSLSQLGLLLLSGAFLTVGYLSAVSAMRIGEISYVAPFRYTSLLVAIIAGLLVFGEWPDLWTWVGAGLVVSAGIYTILRESQLGWRR
ncbi:DMT family transporter [Paracoccus fistulariae]|uniref:DMT family transporter n=1 Tax=Paracoccus fistulariae TaxID=658446 RepID=A0ABY7SJW9_9RHOB|nr:DMT family transporter [Paracoccus fistulariae]MDB6183123.1 DMT family transporter [Paracoccus fistulariae]WCR06837.1 DMT family transporter [Paracoccus fistulariae]